MRLLMAHESNVCVFRVRNEANEVIGHTLDMTKGDERILDLDDEDRPPVVIAAVGMTGHEARMYREGLESGGIDMPRMAIGAVYRMPEGLSEDAEAAPEHDGEEFGVIFELEDAVPGEDASDLRIKDYSLPPEGSSAAA